MTTDGGYALQRRRHDLETAVIAVWDGRSQDLRQCRADADVDRRLLQFAAQPLPESFRLLQRLNLVFLEGDLLGLICDGVALLAGDCFLIGQVRLAGG